MADYVVYHKDCGHIGYIGNHRPSAELTVSAAAAVGNFGYRVRVGASDADIESLMREERCGTCRLTNGGAS